MTDATAAPCVVTLKHLFKLPPGDFLNIDKTVPVNELADLAWKGITEWCQHSLVGSFVCRLGDHYEEVVLSIGAARTAVIYFHFGFEHEEDAVLFKLRWS